MALGLSALFERQVNKHSMLKWNELIREKAAGLTVIPLTHKSQFSVTISNNAPPYFHRF